VVADLVPLPPRPREHGLGARQLAADREQRRARAVSRERIEDRRRRRRIGESSIVRATSESRRMRVLVVS
jgi:hypothetical protein